MNDLPRQQLVKLVARHGPSLVSEPRRCEGLLRDYCGQYRREISVLLMALEEHVASDLLATQTGTPRAVLLAKLASRLCDNKAISEQAARWAVGSWALALGVLTGEQLEGMETPPAQTMPTPEAAANAAQTVRARKSNADAAAHVETLPRVIVVSAAGGGDYLTIQEAVREAAPGSRLLVKPGLYDESIVIDKPLEIAGDGAREEIVVASATASCIQMLTGQAAVRNLTLRGRAGSAGEQFFTVDIPQGKLILEDCDISSETLSCVGIRNPSADPLISRCAIHDGADSGIYIFELAAGTIEDCDIFGNTNVNIAITRNARPVLRRCKIHHGQDAGVVVWGGGAGVVEECEIYGNHSAGIGISQGGEPTVRRCQIYHGANSGVFVHRGGRVLLEECNIFGNRAANVAVTLGGEMRAQACRIHHSRDCGVFLSDDGQARLDGCEINGNDDAGVAVHAGCLAIMRECNISRNGTAGVRVRAEGAARVEGCDLTGNRDAPWELEEGAHVESERNRQ